MKWVLFLAASLSLGVAAVSAQSCAAVAQSGAASTQAAGAVGHSVTASAQVVSGVVAVPVWMSGAASTDVGSVLAASGKTLVRGGGEAMKGANDLWDFANGDPAKRPALDREKALPPSAPAARAKDPSPAEMLKSQL